MIIRKLDHTLCPTKSLGLKISVSCLKPRVLILITPVLKVKMVQGKDTAMLYSVRLSCGSSENGSTCPELRFTASLREEALGPAGSQLQACFLSGDSAPLGQVGDAIF